MISSDDASLKSSRESHFLFLLTNEERLGLLEIIQSTGLCRESSPYDQDDIWLPDKLSLLLEAA